MKSTTTARFRALYDALPLQARKDARRAYRDWQRDAAASSVEFKEIKLRKNKAIWSARTSLGYRAVGMKPNDEEVVWVWIGSHANYDRLIETMRKERGGNPNRTPE